MRGHGTALLCCADTGAPRYPGASGSLMRIGILSGQVRVDLFVIGTRGLGDVHRAEVPLKAFPRCVLLSGGASRLRPWWRRETAILLFQGVRKPMGWRRSSAFCLALDDRVDCVTQLKDQRLAHVFPPPIARTLCTAGKSLRPVFELVLRFFLCDSDV